MTKDKKDVKVELIEEKVFKMFTLDRAKRRWRFVAILAIIALVLLAIYNIGKSDDKTDRIPKKDFIAKIKVEGIIMDDDYRIKRIQKLAKAKNVKAVILEINSPGGSMVPGLELTEELQKLGKEKPLVARMKSVAASAGYMISLASEYVVANEASITGSVGVLMPLIDAKDLADKVGVRSVEVTSGDLKDVTSPLAQRGPKAKQFLQETVNELKDIFIAKVMERRKLTPEVLSIISDGRFLTGQKAYKYKMIDKIGAEKELLDYLYEQKNISKSLEVEEVSLEKEEDYTLQDVFSRELSNSLVKNLKNLMQSVNLTPQLR